MSKVAGSRPRRLWPLAALCAVAGASLALAAPAAAQGLQLVPFGGQAFSAPYHVAGAPGDPSRVFVVEGEGRIRLVKDGVTQSTPFLDIRGDVFGAADGCGGECGMFSVAFAPDYASSGLFYVFYTRDFNPGNHYLRIEEFRRAAGNPDTADPATRRIVLEIPHTTAANHNGGQLQFGPDKYLYIWVGDGGNTPALAQVQSSMLGKILRIDPRGGSPYALPADNPFGNAVYSYGLRNPYRGSFDRSTGDLTTGDVGGGQVEEIDFKSEGGGLGANFGWPCFEGTLNGPGACFVSNHSPPVRQYPNGGGGAAVSGGFVIRDSALPSWQGRYIYADSFNALGDQIHTLDPKAGSASDAATGLTQAGVSSFGQDACGHIYVATFAGQVLRLQPTSGGLPCKLSPALTLKTKRAKRAADKGAVIVKVACDEDCDAVGDAAIKIEGRKRKLEADADSARVQIGDLVKLKLDLSKKETRRLERVLDRGRKAKAKIEVSATGGGGGTDTEKRRIKQRD